MVGGHYSGTGTRIDLVSDCASETVGPSTTSPPCACVTQLSQFSEAHLHDSIEARSPAASTDREAAAEAVARFGSPAQVPAAVNQAAWARVRGPVLRAAADTATRLLAAGLLTMGLTGAAARLVAALTSTAAVYGLPADAHVSAASCRYWLAVHPAAVSCRQAGTLEASSDLTLALGLAGLLGVVLALAVALRGRRRPGPATVLPPVLGPTVAAAVFGVAAIGLAVLAASDAVLLQTWGVGLWWTAAAGSAAAAGVSTVLLIRALPASYTAVQHLPAGPSIAPSWPRR